MTWDRALGFAYLQRRVQAAAESGGASPPAAPDDARSRKRPFAAAASGLDVVQADALPVHGSCPAAGPAAGPAIAPLAPLAPTRPTLPARPTLSTRCLLVLRAIRRSGTCALHFSRPPEVRHSPHSPPTRPPTPLVPTRPRSSPRAADPLPCAGDENDEVQCLFRSVVDFVKSRQGEQYTHSDVLGAIVTTLSDKGHADVAGVCKRLDMDNEYQSIVFSPFGWSPAWSWAASVHDLSITEQVCSICLLQCSNRP